MMVTASASYTAVSATRANARWYSSTWVGAVMVSSPAMVSSVATSSWRLKLRVGRCPQNGVARGRMPGRQPILRQGRAVGWIEDALAPLQETRPDIDIYRLAVAMRSATGIESLIWLTDIAGLSRLEAAELMRHSARVLL